MDDNSILTALGLTDDDIGTPPPGVFETALEYAFNSDEQLDDSTVPTMDDEPVVPDDDASADLVVLSDDDADDSRDDHPDDAVDHPIDDSVDPGLDEPELHVEEADLDHGTTDDPDPHDDGGPELHL